MKTAVQVLASMIVRSEKAQSRFAQGTSQHTLQRNRIDSLHIAMLLVSDEMTGGDQAKDLTKEELERAVAPITSLISKSEKAQKKLANGTWQHSMLEENLEALSIALPLLEKRLFETEGKNLEYPATKMRK